MQDIVCGGRFAGGIGTNLKRPTAAMLAQTPHGGETMTADSHELREAMTPAVGVPATTTAAVATPPRPPPLVTAAAMTTAPTTGRKEIHLATTTTATAKTTKTADGDLSSVKLDFGDLPFCFDSAKEVFVFAAHHIHPSIGASYNTPCLKEDKYGNPSTNILIPLAPCIYRCCYTNDDAFDQKEPVSLQSCLLKLGVLRFLSQECKNLNDLLWHRLNPSSLAVHDKDDDDDDNDDDDDDSTSHSNRYETTALNAEELGKTRIMEFLSSCGIYERLCQLILQQANNVSNRIKEVVKNKTEKNISNKNPYRIPQIHVDRLDEFLAAVARLAPSLGKAREEIAKTQCVNFYPGLGELSPGSKVICYPEGTTTSPPVGCKVVRCWYDYDEEIKSDKEMARPQQTVRRRFILEVEFIVSVGNELVFVTATDIYPDFNNIPPRSQKVVPLRDLRHRKLHPDQNPEDDEVLLQRLQQRGEFYASVATKGCYIEYYPNSFFPIVGSAGAGSGWSRTNSNKTIARPLKKGGRVMVDVKRGILEGHKPVRYGTASSANVSDAVNEVMEVCQETGQTGTAVRFRRCILPDSLHLKSKQQWGECSDRNHLWQSWYMVTGFSFTARVWGKLLLGLPRLVAMEQQDGTSKTSRSTVHGKRPRDSMPKRANGLSDRVGSCSTCCYINFQEQAVRQLVLTKEKKEQILAVARNAVSGVITKSKHDTVEITMNE